ncbi:MAG: amidohydrolase family protein [Pseudomonadales bacterium]
MFRRSPSRAGLLDFGERIGASAELREIFRREIADSAVMLQRARAAGVPLLCGTESGFSITPYGDWHWRELEVFVRELGYTPLEAIRAATSDNAFSLRMAGQTGAVEAGRLADLLIIDGDVAQDITVLGDRSRIRHVFLGGSQVDLTPPPPRRDPGGWRVSHYGNAILRRDVAYGG